MGAALERGGKGGRVNMAELCRMFGVSRQTGDTWVKRFRGLGSRPAMQFVAIRSP
jgi:transposase